MTNRRIFKWFPLFIALGAVLTRPAATASGLPEQGFAKHETPHFHVWHADDEPRVVELGSLLETVYHQYFALSHEAGFVTRRPSGPLTWLFFNDADAYEAHVWRDGNNKIGPTSKGYYCTYADHVMFLHPGEEDLDARAAWPHLLISHEAAHQLAYHSGMQTRGVMYPFWLSEGLATHFETQDGFGADHPARRERLAAAHREGRLPSLNDFLFLVRPDSADRESGMDLYAQAWGVIRFLFECDEAAFRRYVYIMSQLPMGRRPDAALRSEFTRVFGDVDHVQASWENFLEDLSAPTVMARADAAD